MKKLAKSFLLIVQLCLFYSAQAQENRKWPELESFHKTAMNGFHAAEMNKLTPARDSASAMAESAKALQGSQIPDGYDVAALRPLLNNLVEECQQIEMAVTSKKSDSYLRSLVLNAHHTFHEILSKTK